MSYIGSQVRMLYGAGGDQAAQSSAGSNHQLIPENIVATTGRMTVGPQSGLGRWSYHAIVGAGTAPVGTLTIWYSNLPNPDPSVDAHWVPATDSAGTAIAAIDLSVVTPTFKFFDSTADHIRFKVTRTSGTISLVLWTKVSEA